MQPFKKQASKQAVPCMTTEKLARLIMVDIEEHNELECLTGAIQLTSEQIIDLPVPHGRDVLLGLEFTTARIWLDSENYCHYSIIPTVSKVKQSSN